VTFRINNFKASKMNNKKDKKKVKILSDSELLEAIDFYEDETIFGILSSVGRLFKYVPKNLKTYELCMEVIKSVEMKYISMEN